MTDATPHTEAGHYQMVPVGSTIPELQTYIHEWAIRKEWRGEKSVPRSFADEVALIASELFEALEAWRDTSNIGDIWYSWTIEVNGVKFKDCSIEQVMVLTDSEDEDEAMCYLRDLGIPAKAMGVAPELADTGIRLLETCEEYGIPLLDWIQLVMQQNEQREIRHGGKAL